jgi:hypothetical protein
MTSDRIYAILTKKGPLPSSEILKELVLNFGMRRPGATKLIQRSHSEGKIKRFIRLRGGGYLYYLEKTHPIELVRNVARQCLTQYRPKLARIVNVIDKLDLISLFELCRLTNLRCYERENYLNPELVRVLNDLALFGIRLEDNFLLSSALECQKAPNLIKKARDTIKEEAHSLYTIGNIFLKRKWASEFTLNRSPDERSLLEKFDATGKCGFRKKSSMIFELYLRRSVLLEDLLGYQERTWSSMTRKAFQTPLFCLVLANSFEEKALNFALEKKMRPYLIGHNFTLNPILRMNKSATKPLKWHGRLADAQGRAFESVVERVYKAEGFDTETRKKFYLQGSQLTDRKTTRCFTDVDIFAVRGSQEIQLVECKSAKRQISRKTLLVKVKAFGKIGEFLSKDKGDKLHISATIIGKCNFVDKIDAERMIRIPVSFISPKEFYDAHKNQLKGEPRWLF